MRGESMKDKSKKSTYSTTFGVDPNQPILQPGSTPKSVDFNERRRIGQGPSIDNFQSFYSRRLGAVSASSCGGSLL